MAGWRVRGKLKLRKGLVSAEQEILYPPKLGLGFVSKRRVGKEREEKRGHVDDCLCLSRVP
jgi:hypothetical protein